MGTTLTGKRVQNTYDSLLKLSDNDNLTGVAKVVGDGLGNDSPIYLSTSKIGIGVSPTYQFQTSGDGKFGGSLIIAGDLTVNGTTTIVDSTIVAIGDNMIEMAKDNTANTMDIGWYGTIVESGTKYVGTYYDAGSGVTTPTFYIGLGTTEPSSTAEWTVKGKLVIGAIDSTGGTFSGQITIPETPTADGHAASKKYVDDQIADVDVDNARRVIITVKNTETVALSKGTVVHAEPTASPPSGNLVQVKKADYDTASLMPAIGILNEDLDAAGGSNDEGDAVMFGFINGIDTSSFSAGDELYVGNDGSLTNSKPLLTTQLIQKIAVVMKVDSTNGSIEVFGAGRSNDVPNEVDRDLSIAGTLKVDDEIQVEADSGYGRLEVGGPSGGYIDLKTPFSDDYDLRIITNSSGSEFTGSGDFNINAGNTLTLTLDGTTQDATFAADIFSDGLYVNSTSAVAGTQVAIVKDGEQNLQRWGTANSGQDSYRFRIDQDMKFIANSGSGDNLTIFSDTGNLTTTGQVDAYSSTFRRGTTEYALRLDSTSSSTDNDLRFAKGGTDYAAIQNNSNTTHNFEFYVNTDGSSSGWLNSFYIERANGNVNFNYAINSIGNSGGMYFYNTGSGHGVIETMSGKDLNILSGSGNIYVKDNLQLNASNTSPSIIFANDAKTRKIVLYDAADNDYQFYGFGLETRTLVYSTYTTDDDHVFFAGTSSTTRDELARIKGDGGVQFSQYGSGSFTGTSAYNLAVDSSGNIIETAGSVLDGSGTANYIPKWSDANTLTNSVMYESSGDLIASGNLYIGDDASNNQGLRIESGNGTSDYGVVRFLHGGTNRNTIHAFSQYWQSGTIYTAATDSINLDGNAGVTIGPWNNIDVAFVQGSTNYFRNGIGVGITNPTAKLDVAGTIRAGNITSPTSGVGVEILYSSGDNRGFIGAYDRSNAVYKEFLIFSSNLLLESSGTVFGKFNSTFSYLTNSNSGNYEYPNLGGRLLTSNGTGWSADGRDPILTLSSSGNSNDTNIANSIGLNLYSNSNNNNTYSPAIAFSGLSNSSNYASTYGMIIGKKTGQGVDSNWNAGELHFFTGKVSAYMQSTPDMLIDSSGRVGIGVQPSMGLHVADTKGALFGPANAASTYISPTDENTINGGYGYDTDTADVWLNYRGYQDGFTRFRDTRIGNGKGSAVVHVDGSANNMGIGKSPDSNYALDINEKLRITAGMVMIPTTSNLYATDGALSYYATTNGVYLNGAGTNGWLRLQSSGTTNNEYAINIMGANDGGYIDFRTANVERMKIMPTGKIGIHDPNPDAALSIIQQDTTRPTVTINNAAAGGSGYVFQRWQYVASTTAYLCDLTQKVTSGVVRYAFDVVNNSTSYPNNLVLDRGQIGIGVETPSATLHINASTPSLTLETSDNSNDPVITLKSNGPITGEGAQIYYDNSVGTLHLTTTYVASTADIVFHTATGADQATGNVRMRVKGNGDTVFKETLSTKDNRINSGYSDAANDSDIWINYEGYQNDLSYYRDFRVGNGRGSQIAIFDGSTSRVGIMVSSKYPDAKFEVYHDGGNGGGNLTQYGILAKAGGAYQATIGAHSIGDGYANLNLSSDVSGQKLWHISKRVSSNGHRLEWFYYDAGFISRFAFFTNGDFHADGDIVAYSTTISDASLKDNVVTIDNALDKVKKLRGVSYKWNSGPRNQQKDLGVIAQEVEKVLPEIVYEKQALYHGSKQVKSVDYEKLTAVLIESVKELSAKVEALENKKCNCNCNCK